MVEGPRHWFQSTGNDTKIKFTALMTTDNKSKFIFCSFPSFILFVVSVSSTWKWWSQEIIMLQYFGLKMKKIDTDDINDGESCWRQPSCLKTDAEEKVILKSPSQFGLCHEPTFAPDWLRLRDTISPYANIFCLDFGCS